MRFMVMIKATKDTEAGALPSREVLTEMGKYNEQLLKSGIMLAGEGLLPSVRGARIDFSGGAAKVTDGPFAETKELVAGFWLWQVRSKEEAVEWAKRIPNPEGSDFTVEIRQVFEPEDFAPVATPELIENERRLRAEAAQRTNAG